MCPMRARFRNNSVSTVDRRVPAEANFLGAKQKKGKNRVEVIPSLNDEHNDSNYCSVNPVEIQVWESLCSSSEVGTSTTQFLPILY